MRIEHLQIRSLVMPLQSGFETSFGRVATREMVVVSLHAGGLVGWGEAPVADRPHYSAETARTAMSVLRDHMGPAIVGQDLTSADDLLRAIDFVRGHHMARAALEWALLDLHCKAEGRSLADALGAAHERVPVGVSLGIPGDRDAGALVALVERRVAEGYRRIKLKIRPGFCAGPVRAVRERFPDVALCADGNGGFGWDDLDELRALDDLGLLFVEQPFRHDDLLEHARLRRRVRTPICLDESLVSPAALDAALALDAIDVVNLKSGRVGGLTQAQAMIRTCRERALPLWCGGMLETGIGRAAHVALAACPGFTQPGDLSASDRYYAEDLVDPPFRLDAAGTLGVPDGPGIGVTVLEDRLERATRERVDLTA
jgi:O-succinylbenzoate synthase